MEKTTGTCRNNIYFLIFYTAYFILTPFSSRESQLGLFTSCFKFKLIMIQVWKPDQCTLTSGFTAAHCICLTSPVKGVSTTHNSLQLSCMKGCVWFTGGLPCSWFYNHDKTIFTKTMTILRHYCDLPWEKVH